MIQQRTINRILIVALILLIMTAWVGQAVWRMVEGHHDVLRALSHGTSEYRSNFVDPKPFLIHASVHVGRTLPFYLLSPFTINQKLLYYKHGYLVCSARYPVEGKWHLTMPPEILDITIEPKKNLLIPILTPPSDNSSAQEDGLLSDGSASAENESEQSEE